MQDWGFYFRVSQDEYKTNIKGKFLKELDDPYFVGFYGFICGVIRFLAEKRVNEPVDFIFDEQLHQSDVVKSAYSLFLRDAPDQI